MFFFYVGGGQMFHADYFVIIRYNLQMSNSFYNLNILCSHRHKCTTSELNCSTEIKNLHGDSIFNVS